MTMPPNKLTPGEKLEQIIDYIINATKVLNPEGKGFNQAINQIWKRYSKVKGDTK